MNSFNTLRGWAREAGLTKIPLVRHSADVIKRTVLGFHVQIALPIQGFWLSGFGLWQYLIGTYEAETTNYFNRTIKPGWTMVDVGAAHGYFSLLFSKLVGQEGQVFVFEPWEELYKHYLLKNLARNHVNNVIFSSLGLSDHSGKEYYNEEAHAFFPNPPQDLSTEAIEVEVFDTYFKAYSGRVDIVKIDVEGREPSVIRGMQHTIEANKDIRIVFEVAPHLLFEKGSSPEQLFDLLESFGMHFFWIEEAGIETHVSREELRERLSKIKYTNVLAHR